MTWTKHGPLWVLTDTARKQYLAVIVKQGGGSWYGHHLMNGYGTRINTSLVQLKAAMIIDWRRGKAAA